MRFIASIIMVAVVFVSFTADLPASETRDEGKRKRLTIMEARNLFSQKIVGIREIAEFTTAEVWRKMKLQVFTVRKKTQWAPHVFYIIDMKSMYEIGGDYQPAIDMKIADLDRNGYYELYFSYQTGSGVSMGNFGCYTEGMFLPVSKKLTPPGLSAVYNYVFKKSGATYAVEIHEGKKVTKLGNLFIKKHINGRREVSVY